MHGMAQRTRDDVAKAGGVFTLAVGLVVAVLLFACEPTRTHDVLWSAQTIDDAVLTASHVTVRISRSAIDEADGLMTIQAWISTEARPVRIVPDDASLDALVTDDDLGQRLDIEDIATVCPSEGSCEIGLTLEIAEHEAGAGGQISGTLTKHLERGNFSEAATLEVAFD